MQININYLIKSSKSICFNFKNDSPAVHIFKTKYFLVKNNLGFAVNKVFVTKGRHCNWTNQ